MVDVDVIAISVPLFLVCVCPSGEWARGERPDCDVAGIEPLPWPTGWKLK
jgi:hypothetical protein